MLIRSTMCHLRTTGVLFNGLTNEQRVAIFTAGVLRRYEAHRTIIRTDVPALHLYFVQLGNVNFYRTTKDGQQIILGRLLPTDVFGLGSLVTEPVHYIGTAETVTETEVYLWERAHFRRLAAAYPLLAQNSMRILLHYIGLFVKRHMALVSESAEERLAYTLTQLGSRAGHILPAGLELEIKNEDLASLADISLFTASRLLQNWQRKGALEKHRGKVVITRPEQLLVA